MSIPGFTAEASLYERRVDYSASTKWNSQISDQAIVPQMPKAWLCTFLGLAIVGGQEELIPVFIGLCAASA